MEPLIQVLIYTHAFMGGLGLLSGAVSIMTQKGGRYHKKSGKLFSFTMIFSALISLIVARMPGHENLFLFLIGIFTIYMILAGNRALTFKRSKKKEADLVDKAISGGMFLASLAMLGLGIAGFFFSITNSILYLFFGFFGAFMSLKDFQTFKSYKTDKNAWIVSHIGRMTGAFIASVTAFLVAGLQISTLAVWISPTIVGTIYIIYWSRKYRSRTT